MTETTDQEDDPFAELPYDEAGVDRSLIRWMLSLTPEERLAVLQAHVDLLAQVRRRTTP